MEKQDNLEIYKVQDANVVKKTQKKSTRKVQNNNTVLFQLPEVAFRYCRGLSPHCLRKTRLK